MGSDKGAGCLIMGLLTIVFVGMVMTGIIGGIQGERAGELKIRAEAVEHGYGEWVANPRGKTTFKWKE